MVDPLFWLGLSILLVAVSITAVLMAALPAFRELSRAARSAEKLFDTLHRELPPTLEAIRLTSMEITELTDDMTEGVQNVGRMTQQVDEGVTGVRQQAKQAQITTRSVVAGFKAALGTFVRPQSRRSQPVPTRPGLPASQVEAVEEADFEAAEIERTEEAMEAPVTRAAESQSIHAQPLPAEVELHHRSVEPASKNALEAPIAPAESAVQPAHHNGKSHPTQLRASSPPINIAPSAAEKSEPRSIESRQQH